jgi:hypothetical protein
MSEKILEGVTYRYRFVTDKRDQERAAFTLKAPVKKYPGMDAWFFAEVPAKTAKLIRRAFGHKARGWGSLKVDATIGSTTWNTSIFPDKKSGTYLLPLKAAVRKAESIRAGKPVALKLEIA